MRDEFDDRLYQASRHALNQDIARLIRSVAYAFDRLQARLYDAPWSNERQRHCKGEFTAL